MINVNCICFQSGGGCLHQAAPKAWLINSASCILVFRHNDPRIPEGCALQVKHEKPEEAPIAPRVPR